MGERKVGNTPDKTDGSEGVFGCHDYAQLMEARTHEAKRYLEIAKTSSESKRLAGELDVGVILLSQLNQDGALRESASLKHDSDIVFVLNRDGDKVEVDIQKNRNGRRGTLMLRFDEDTVSFSDWIDEPADVRMRAAGE